MQNLFEASALNVGMSQGGRATILSFGSQRSKRVLRVCVCFSLIHPEMSKLLTEIKTLRSPLFTHIHVFFSFHHLENP